MKIREWYDFRLLSGEWHINTFRDRRVFLDLPTRPRDGKTGLIVASIKIWKMPLSGLITACPGWTYPRFLYGHTNTSFCTQYGLIAAHNMELSPLPIWTYHRLLMFKVKLDLSPRVYRNYFVWTYRRFRNKTKLYSNVSRQFIVTVWFTCN